MLVSDLQHFLDLPDSSPGPTRRLADHLANIIRAASAGEPISEWESALPCRRRPAHRRCAGRIIVARTEPDAPIHWRCSACHDAGVITNWVDSPFDLRRRRLVLAHTRNEYVVSDEVAAALRELRLLERESERLVYAMRAHQGGAVLVATDEDIEELIDCVAAEANHEPDRRRQWRFDTAFAELNTVVRSHDRR